MTATCRPRRGRGWVIALAIALAVGAAPAAGADSPEERRLQQTQAALERVRSQLDLAEDERDAAAEGLDEAERQLEVVVAALQDAEMAVQRQEQAVAAARARLDDLEAEARRQERVRARRAVDLYRQGVSTAPWTALLTARDVDDAVQRSAYVEVLSRSDRALFEQVEIAQVQVDAQARALEAEEATLDRVLEQQREIHAQVAALREERALVLAGVEERLRELEADEDHLEGESRELAALARRASQVSSAAGRGGGGGQAVIGVGAGGWTWPASGPITSRFGMRWGRMHEGIDIGAATGSAVVSARGGQVTFAGRMGGYGNLVLVAHPGGLVTAYAHLSSINVASGQAVDAGQRLGGVGCTGSCTGPHLHFEVRLGGGARNPLGYLP